jgi:hypothetical protein
MSRAQSQSFPQFGHAIHKFGSQLGQTFFKDPKSSRHEPRLRELAIRSVVRLVHVYQGGDRLHGAS